MIKENELIELKKSLSQLKEKIISLSAMLNKHKKGEVLSGINDNGDVYGISIGEKLLLILRMKFITT